MRRRTSPRRTRLALAFAASTTGPVLFIAAAAFACTNHTGNCWFCAAAFGSGGCLSGQSTAFGSLANNTNYYLDGGALAASTSHTFRWTTTTSSEALCHSSTNIWTTASSNGFGNITTSPQVYTGTSPGAGDGRGWPWHRELADVHHEQHGRQLRATRDYSDHLIGTGSLERTARAPSGGSLAACRRNEEG